MLQSNVCYLRCVLLNTVLCHSDVGLPAGASASVRYASKTKFGAVLIAQKPITLTSYNDETLFRHWLASNRAKLAELHGVELSRYGLWLVTRTYTCPKASINAWESKDEDASMSVKVKANMVGDFGGDLDWSEKGTDKDWAHYAGEQGVVAFFDGIEIPAWQLWLDGAKARLGAMVGEIAGKEKKMLLNRQGLLPAGSWKPIKDADPRSQSAPGADDAWVPSRKDKGQRKQIAVEADSMSEKAPSGVGQPRQNTTDDDDTKGEPPAEADLWGSSTPLRQGSPASRSLSRGRQQSVSIRSPSRNVSTPSRLSKYLDSERYLIRDVPDPALRLSTASTTTGNHGITTKDYAIDGAEHSPPDRSRPHELRRKTPTPSLRSSSLRDVYA